MADKKQKTQSKAILEREYNVPLRREWLKVPLYKRSNKAVKALREFLVKHMKSEDIKLGKYVNELIWQHGIRNPPHHVKVKVVKYDDGVVKAELVGKEYQEALKSKPKQEKATGLKGKLQEALGKTEEAAEESKEEAKAEEPKAEKQEEPKAEPKKADKTVIKAPAKKASAKTKSAPAKK